VYQVAHGAVLSKQKKIKNNKKTPSRIFEDLQDLFFSVRLPIIFGGDQEYAQIRLE
jgi:hypothetical protein